MFLTVEGGGHSMIGGFKKSNWIIYIPPSVIYLLFSYLINMEGWIYHDWYIKSEIIYVTPWKLLRIFKVAKYWKQLNLSQYCIYATTFLICLTTSEFSTLDKSYKRKKTTEKNNMLFSEEDVFMNERDGSVTKSTKSRKVTLQDGSSFIYIAL